MSPGSGQFGISHQKLNEFRLESHEQKESNLSVVHGKGGSEVEASDTSHLVHQVVNRMNIVFRYMRLIRC
jgi:DNA-nicking Smr family endonuclease